MGMATSRPILDTFSTLILEDNYLFVFLISALSAGAVFLMVTRRW